MFQHTYAQHKITSTEYNQAEQEPKDLSYNYIYYPDTAGSARNNAKERKKKKRIGAECETIHTNPGNWYAYRERRKEQKTERRTKEQKTERRTKEQKTGRTKEQKTEGRTKERNSYLDHLVSS